MSCKPTVHVHDLDRFGVNLIVVLSSKTYFFFTCILCILWYSFIFHFLVPNS